MNELRGGAFEFSIKGTDELIIEHDSVMLEACNSSFQVHLQVTAAEFGYWAYEGHEWSGMFGLL